MKNIRLFIWKFSFFLWWNFQYIWIGVFSLCSPFNSYASLRYIHLCLGNWVAIFLEKGCHPFFLWLFNCICVSFSLMLMWLWLYQFLDSLLYFSYLLWRESEIALWNLQRDFRFSTNQTTPFVFISRCQGINIFDSQSCGRITKTCLYNIDPLKPHFYMVKLECTGVYIIFLISAKNYRLWVLVRTVSPMRF